MQPNHMKRSLSLLLALVMVLSMVPVHALAAGTDHHDHQPETEDTLYQQLQAQTDALLLEDLGGTSMTDDETRAAVDAMDGAAVDAAAGEIHAMTEQFSQLSDDQLQAFAAENPTFVAYSAQVMAAQDDTAMPMAASGSVLSGQITVSDTSSNVSVSGSTVTVTVKGSGGLTSGSTATNTVTVTNTSGSTAAVSFDYACSATGTFTFSQSANSGTWSGMLAAGEAVTMTMTATGGALFSSSTATLKLTNFSLTAAKDSSNVTVDFDAAMGSVTADGTAITAGTTIEGVTPAEGVALVAAPAKGYVFACWVNTESGTIAAYEPSYTLQPMDDVAVRAVFHESGGDACFRIGKTLYYHLNDALAAASAGDVITLVSSGTLAPGDYVIPSGITLLIPHDESGTVFTTAPQSASSATTPSAYRTLTLAAGANLTVNGTMSVTAKHYRNSGRPVGKYGYVKLSEGSSVKVGGTLYAYGFIGGKGTVKIMSGAAVYEYFQIIDFRGGTATLAMYGNNNEVFPLSQYYVQNVEAPMTLEAGATEYGYTTLYMSSTEYHSTVKFIGTSGAMFNLTSGSVTKEYDGAADRLMIRANGTMTLEPMSLTVSTMSINSGDYVLPINSSITIELEGGTATIKQDLALQPTAQLVVDAGATCALASGIRLYVYDQDQWGSYVYSAAQLRAVPYAPGRTYKSATSSSRTVNGDAAIVVAGTLDTSAGKLYTTEGGAAITGVEGGTVKMASVASGSTYQATQSGTSVSYDTIAVTSAKLLNADGTYLATSANTYTYENGAWGVYCAHSYSSVTTPATCTAPGSTTYTCSNCGRSYSEEIPALGHTPGAAVTENETAATCTTDGSYDSVEYCTVCSAELSRVTTTVSAAGHSWNDGETTTAPGCESAGEKTYTCTACGDTRTEAVDALGHAMVYTSTKEPTCTEDGEAASAYCSRCGYVETSGGVIPALGHDWVQSAATDATCTESGSISYACSRCGETKTDTVPAAGHTYESTVTAPTCTTDGYTTYTCTVCADTYTGDTVPATGHRYTGVTTAPTCTEAGYTIYTCGICGDTYTGDIMTATGHDYGDGSVTLVATCTTEGTRTYTCAVCKDSYAVPIPALGHDLTAHAAKLASYTSVGWDAYEECSRCDHSTYVEYPILPRSPVADYNTFLENLLLLEQIADRYADENPGADPLALVLNYIRTGIPSYTTTSWAIMAGAENTAFTAYVLAYEDAYNASVTEEADLISVVSIRSLRQFPAPSDPSFNLEFTHMFGTMDITAHNPGSRDHADVAGWAGDLVDLLDLVDNKTDVKVLESVEEMVSAIFAGDYLAGAVESFGRQDMYGDLDAFYIMKELSRQEYRTGLLTEILEGYFVDGLKDADRAAYFIANRMDGVTNRASLRDAVYAAYVSNKVNTTLEGTRTFASDSEKLYDLRRACCYAFADYLWRLAGDYVADGENTDFTISAAETVTLAPGILRQTNDAVAADGTEIRYHVTTADLNSGYVRIDAAAGSGTLLTQAQNYGANVLSGISADAVAPGSFADADAFAAVLSGTELVRDGQSVAPAGERTAATAAGVTRTGKAVFVSADSATPAELARMLLDAGCTTGVLLDSSTASFVSRTETDTAFTDHTQNAAAVPAVLLMISTAPDDTAFHHAVLNADYSYLTVNAALQITASGVTARGSAAEIPEGELTWSVSDETMGSISADGLFTASAVGDVEVILNLDGTPIGSLTLHVVTPDTLYFTTSNINAFYGEPTALPIAALYQRKSVALSPADVTFEISANEEGISGGAVSGFDFTGSEESGLKTVTVTAALAADANVHDAITITMYNPGDVVFDFDAATGGNRQLAWLREVSNSTTEDGNTYHVVDPSQPMVTDYTFAIDMAAIEVPDRLKDLTNMLPGADQTDGTAWGFLLQLADRVSDLSQVQASIQIDPNFDADLTNLSLQNEYFTLSNAVLDEETNLLTVTLNWVKQPAAIDPATANPICVVSGIALTPKADAPWDENSSLTPVHGGTLSYEFYLSAGALYTFAGDPANQAAYGLTPYINPANSSDRGASFGADYASFTDTYTLVSALKNGWYFENGENVFYVDGVLHTQHTPGDSVTTPPDCTQGGYTTHLCAVCGVTYTADETEALGHNYESVVTAPTCTEGGFTTNTCSVCNHTYTDVETDALGHAYESVVTEPTCTEGGFTTHTCSRCDSVVVDNHTEALGHDYESVVTDPTCTEGGFTTHTCSVCGDTYTDAETEALGHDYESVVTEPTCTDGGFITHTCSICGDSYEDAETDALGHDYESVVTAPTCTDGGFTTHTCSTCGDSYKDTETDALGHNYESVVTAPTCTDGGFTTHTCSVCGDTYTDAETEALGHDYDSVVTAPTCTEGGVTTHTCSVCGDTYTDAETEALGHDYESVVTEPTCTEGGFTTYSCSRCNSVVVDNQTEALGHNYDSVITEPTCTEGGFTTHSCSRCDSVVVDNQTEALGHNYDSVVTEPTCTEGGFTTHTCTVCGDSYTDAETDALGHDYESVVTAPTCTDGGFTTHTCSTCGDSYKDTETDALGHNYESVVTAPTCTESGFTTHSCSRCDSVVVDSHTEALGHDYDSVVTAPTCTDGGFTTHTCTVCGDTYKNAATEALGHDYESVVTEPTCTDGGFTTHTCSVCGDNYKDAEVEALGHDYESVVTEPTCTEGGFTTHTCSVCSDTFTDTETDALGHGYENGICTVCGALAGVAHNTATGTSYATVAEALKAAQKGQTVILLTDCAENMVMVTPGVTLDLKGFRLTAAYAVGFDTAHIIDSTGTGCLVTAVKNVVLDEENAMLPVYNGEGYVFTEVGFAIRRNDAFTGEGIQLQALACPVNMAAVALLKDGVTDNNIQIVIRLSWETADSTGSQEFVFTDAVAAQVYSSNNGTWSDYSRMFCMTITGFEGVRNLSANIVMVSGTNTQYISNPITN